MITLKEIARMCGVSASTVSNILNGKRNVSEETRKKVLEIVTKTQYQPNSIAQGLRNQKTRLIGIIAEDISLFSTPEMIESIMAYFESKDYKFVLENLRLYARWNDQWFDNRKGYCSVLKPAMQELLSIKVDGIIYIAGHSRVIDCFPDDLQIPAVVAYGYSASRCFPSVVIDDEKGGYDMTEYLISMGHKKIGLLGGKPDNIHTRERLLGYQKALFENGILYDPGLVRYGSWDRGSGYREAGGLLDRNVTAIFCLADRMAGGVYDYFAEHDLTVGKEVSVAGYDNQIMSEYMYPALTTMDLPLSKIGTRAAEILFNLLEKGGGNSGAEILPSKYPCSLMARDSVRRIAGSDAPAENVPESSAPEDSARPFLG